MGLKGLLLAVSWRLADVISLDSQQLQWITFATQLQQNGGSKTTDSIKHGHSIYHPEVSEEPQAPH